MINRFIARCCGEDRSLSFNPIVHLEPNLFRPLVSLRSLYLHNSLFLPSCMGCKIEYYLASTFVLIGPWTASTSPTLKSTCSARQAASILCESPTLPIGGQFIRLKRWNFLAISQLLQVVSLLRLRQPRLQVPAAF